MKKRLMEKSAQIRLRQFIEDNFDFETLQEVGFFDKTYKKTQYVRIAKRICWFFGFKSIYEYAHVLDNCSGIVCLGVEDDPSGLASGGTLIIKPKVDVSKPENWSKLPLIDKIELITQDKWLN